MPPFSPLSRSSQVLTCLLTLSLFGCQKSDPDQVKVVQQMATALTQRGPKGAQDACSHLVGEQQKDKMGCENLLIPLLHYAPGFPGSSVTRRAATKGSLFSRNQPVKVPVRYESPKGSGNLDVTMQREGGTWRVFSLFPVP